MAIDAYKGAFKKIHGIDYTVEHVNYKLTLSNNIKEFLAWALKEAEILSSYLL